MLSLLLSFEVKSCKTTQIFLTDSFIHSGSTANALPVVMCCVCPPVSLRFYIAKNHVLNCCRKTRNLKIQFQCSFCINYCFYKKILIYSLHDCKQQTTKSTICMHTRPFFIKRLQCKHHICFSRKCKNRTFAVCWFT